MLDPTKFGSVCEMKYCLRMQSIGLLKFTSSKIIYNLSKLVIYQSLSKLIYQIFIKISEYNLSKLVT